MTRLLKIWAILFASATIFSACANQCCCFDPNAANPKGYLTDPNFCGGKQLCTTDKAQAAQVGCGDTGYNFGPRQLDILATLLPRSPRQFARASGGVNNSPSVGIATVTDPPSVSEASSDHFSCLKHCPNGKVTADCMVARIESQNVKPLREFIHEVMSTDGKTLSHAQLMARFHIKDDPCNRGDTTLSASDLTNAGASCTIDQSTAKFHVLIQLHLPERLQGVWQSHTPSDSRLNFVGTDSPTVHFFNTKSKDKDPLDDDFGGNALWIESDGARVMVRTNAPGCIGVQL